jgi:hypothetical protein
MPRAAAKKAGRTKTTPYDVAEHLRTPEEMAALILTPGLRRRRTTPPVSRRRWGTLPVPKECRRLPKTPDLAVRASIAP